MFWWERLCSCLSRCLGVCRLIRPVILVVQALVLKRPRFHIRVSPKPRASVLPMRAVSAPSSVPPDDDAVGRNRVLLPPAAANAAPQRL